MPKRIQIYYRKGSWEVKRGKGRWKAKYPVELTDKQVRSSLTLEYPGSVVSRFYRTPTNGPAKKAKNGDPK